MANSEIIKLTIFVQKSFIELKVKDGEYRLSKKKSDFSFSVDT